MNSLFSWKWVGELGRYLTGTTRGVARKDPPNTSCAGDLPGFHHPSITISQEFSLVSIASQILLPQPLFSGLLSRSFRMNETVGPTS